MKIIWLIFTVMFFCLAMFHFSLSTTNISHIQSKAAIKTINGMPLGIGDFITDFNKYIDQVNQSNGQLNFLAMVGYILAGFSALYSFKTYPWRSLTVPSR